jgi:hypothetical protein
LLNLNAAPVFCSPIALKCGPQEALGLFVNKKKMSHNFISTFYGHIDQLLLSASPLTGQTSAKIFNAESCRPNQDNKTPRCKVRSRQTPLLTL